MNNPQTKMKPDEAAAGLALATHISQQTMPKAPQEEQPMGEEPQTSESAPEQAEQQPEAQPTEEVLKEENQEMVKLTKDFDEFKGKIEGVIDTKFSELTKTIQDALKSE